MKCFKKKLLGIKQLLPPSFSTVFLWHIKEDVKKQSDGDYCLSL